MFLYHAFDEVGRAQWQSGVYYVDHKPKPSLKIVQRALDEVKRGVIARCPGMRLKVTSKIRFEPPKRAASAAKRGLAVKFRLRCNLDCNYTSGVINASGKSILARLGQAIGGKTKTIRFPARKLDPGRYRVNVSLVAAVNPGRATRRASVSFVVR